MFLRLQICRNRNLTFSQTSEDNKKRGTLLPRDDDETVPRLFPLPSAPPPVGLSTSVLFFQGICISPQSD